MRLLNTTSLSVGEFKNDEIPPYAILSHTWGEDEVTLQYMQGFFYWGHRKGYEKAKKCCAIAKANGFEYVWIDTCCIDKTSSMELSEAINSMYRWYEEADICYAYLADVPSGAGIGTEFRSSKWFTRGWTLQELLAPSKVIFLDSQWQKIGDKFTLQGLITGITGIPSNFLLGDYLGYASVAQRMSWAAKRKTTRIEDVAYCLMGMFGIYMPMLYGEGERAFIRLQEEILKVTNDHSLFAWRSTEDHGGILATSPAAFDKSGNIIQASASPFAWRIGQAAYNKRDTLDDISQTSSSNTISSAPTVTSRGIRLSLPFGDTGLAILDCMEMEQENKRLAIHLEDVFLTRQDFTRGKSSTLKSLDLETINQSQYPQTDLHVRQWRSRHGRKKENIEKCAIRLGLKGTGKDEAASRITCLDPTWEFHEGLMITTTELPTDGILGRLFIICSDGNSFQLVLNKRGKLLTTVTYDGFEVSTNMAHNPITSGQQQHKRDRVVSVLRNGQHMHVTIENRFYMLHNERHLVGVVEINYPNMPGMWFKHVAVVEGEMKEKTLLSHAAGRGSDALVKLLLDTVECGNERGHEGPTDEDKAAALSLAASNGHETAVMLLLESGASPFRKDSSGQKPSVYAKLNGHEAIYSLLERYSKCQ